LTYGEPTSGAAAADQAKLSKAAMAKLKGNKKRT
jgi:hypothetical protein